MAASASGSKNLHYKDLKITIDTSPSSNVDNPKPIPTTVTGKTLRDRLSAKRKSNFETVSEDNLKRNKINEIAERPKQKNDEKQVNSTVAFNGRFSGGKGGTGVKSSISDRLGWKK